MKAPRGSSRDRSRGAVGVLALQGAFELHAAAVRAIGRRVVLVRSSADLDDVDGLILPGGESTVQLDLLARLGMEESLRRLVARGTPVLATCAGLIVLSRVARAADAARHRPLELLDVAVERNAWGRQVDSFEATSDGGRALVFIRAPRIVEVGPAVEVLDTFEGEPILVRERNITAATFHPELTADRELYRACFEARGLSWRDVRVCRAGSPG